MLRKWLAHPLTRGLDINDPRTTELRREVIRRKPFLERIYRDWYAWMASQLPDVAGRVVELGAGAGFLGEYIPGLIPTEIFLCKGTAAVLDGQRLPFAAGSLRALVFTDVLHHLPQARRFFTEAGRCVRPGGRVIMIEPWVSGWSRFIYPRLHHERFDPDAAEWEFPTTGPLSGSNQALPWIIFSRDREIFAREFPQWRVRELRPGMALRYLVSGGLTTRSLMPAWTYPAWQQAERLSGLGGMFVSIVLERS